MRPGCQGGNRDKLRSLFDEQTGLSEDSMAAAGLSITEWGIQKERKLHFLPALVILGQLLKPSPPQFVHLQNGDKNRN